MFIIEILKINFKKKLKIHFKLALKSFLAKTKAAT
jgi:hypothetical protein